MTHVSITVDDAHLNVMSEVVAALRARGLQVDQVLNAVGIVTGWVTPGRRTALETVDGVTSVVESEHFKMPPPDSPVQ